MLAVWGGRQGGLAVVGALCAVVLCPFGHAETVPAECSCTEASPRRPSARVTAPASIDQLEVNTWLADYSVKRAQFYLNESARLLDVALAQARGEDDKQNDPYVKLWEATNNILAAIDLAPRDGSVWVQAGLLHFRSIAYSEESEDGAEEEALAMIRTGIRLAKEVSDTALAAAMTPLQSIKASKCRPGKDGGLRVKKKAVSQEEREMFSTLCRRVEKLEKGGKGSVSILGQLFSTRFRGGADTPTTSEYIGLVDEPAEAAPACEACPPGATPQSSYLQWARDQATTPTTHDSSGANADHSVTVAATPSAAQTVRHLLNQPENLPTQVFSTPLLRINLAEFFGNDALRRLGEIASSKYASFAEQKRAEGMTASNDINDDFFTSQMSGNDRTGSEAHTWWPELYRDSEDWTKLVAVLEEAAVDFAFRLSTARDDLVDRETLRQTTYSVIWAAVYPEGVRGGGRHGAHAHQATISSCVFYAVTGNTTAPIGFYDPRGAHVHKDYERHMSEFEWQPRAPFHQPLWVFPEAGDLVCFPSWLIHTVPTKLDASTYRVAFPINLQVEGTLDSWHMTATST